MACMEHACIECSHTWFDNRPGGYCPECGSRANHFFDEDPRDYEREYAAAGHADDDADEEVV